MERGDDLVMEGGNGQLARSLLTPGSAQNTVSRLSKANSVLKILTCHITLYVAADRRTLLRVE